MSGSRRNEIQEGYHLALGVEHGIVHVDVDDLGTVFDLFTGYVQGFFVILFRDETQELARPGHVATFAYIDEVVLGNDFQLFQSRQAEPGLAMYRPMRCGLGGQAGDGGDVGRCGTAAAPHDIDQCVVEKFLDLCRHGFGRFVVLPESVG